MRYVWLLLSVFLLISCSNSVSTDDNSWTTSLNITVPEDGHVHAWIENAYQTKVETIINGHLKRGTHLFPLTMEDENGKPLPYGIYTSHIETEKLNISRTFVYAKPNSRN